MCKGVAVCVRNRISFIHVGGVPPGKKRFRNVARENQQFSVRVRACVVCCCNR